MRKNVNIGRMLATSGPRGMLVGPKEIETIPITSWW